MLLLLTSSRSQRKGDGPRVGMWFCPFTNDWSFSPRGRDTPRDTAKIFIENRTQWRKDDVARVEQLRNEVTATEQGGKLTADAKEKKKVKHKH